MDIRLAGVVKESIVDGPGLRYTLFAQGCPHNCPHCHNPHTHDAAGGQLYAIDTIVKEIKQNPLLSGITFSGGEPFCQSKAFSRLAEALEGKYNIYCYTGYTFEELFDRDEDTNQLLSLIDVLIDGPFVYTQKSVQLQFKGSRNQRTIDCKSSLLQGRVIEIE